MTDKQKEYFRQFGEDERTFPQIDEAMRRTSYMYVSEMPYEVRKLKRAEAISILGEEEWLSGIRRAAFHRTALRYTDEKNCRYVLFDASVMWR